MTQRANTRTNTPVSRPRRAAIALGVTGLLALGLGFGGRYAWSQYQLGLAERSLKRYDLAGARRHLERSLGYGRDPRAQFLAAQTARRLDACGDAERLLAEYELANGATEASKLEWVLLGVQQGDFAGHERPLMALVNQDRPDGPLILEALAKGYMNSLRWDQSVKCSSELLDREPGSVPALVLRGKGLDGMRHTEAALEDFQRAVDAAPDSAGARLSLAAVLYRIGHSREATYHYEVLHQSEPSHAEGLLGLARCRFEGAELDRAEQHLDALLAAQPGHVEGLVERGSLALRRGQPDTAEQYLARAVAEAPWHREAHHLRLFCAEAQGKSDEVASCQARLRELEASDAVLGRLAARFRHAPQDPSLRCELGTWFLRNGQGVLGVRWLFTALRIDPRHVPTHAALADYFEQSGQPRRAAGHRQMAVGAVSGGQGQATRSN
jgi:Tfp pilus assembly protein PilF